MNPYNTLVVYLFVRLHSHCGTDIIFSSVFDAKRLIGRKFADAEVQSDVKHFPFTVLDKSGKPYVQVEYRGEKKEFVSIIFFGCWQLNLIFLCRSLPRRFRLWC